MAAVFVTRRLKSFRPHHLHRFMWNEPSDVELGKLPGLYETESTPLEDKIIQMHFFLGGCDWYAAEYGPADRLFFGYAILNHDHQNAEWGYFSLDEMRSVKTSQGYEIDRDLNWRPRPARMVDKIRFPFD